MGEPRSGDGPSPSPAMQANKRVETLRYRPGGFHPVHLSDTFKDGRYTVIHKLGHGGFATVWLARDSNRSRYVALKILAGRLSKESPEVEILRRLQKNPGEGGVGKEYVMKFLDHFTIAGPNGKHLCVVSQVGGPTIKLWNESPGKRSGTRRLRAETARKVSLQAVEGLAFIHSTGIVHGDFTSANILLQLANIDDWTIEEIHERLGKPQIQELSGDSANHHDLATPRYTVNAISMKEVDPQWLSDQIMIIDFGIAFPQEESSPSIGTPKSYCAPEFLFDSPRSVSSDIWALSCTTFEIRTGSALFKYKAATPNMDHVLKGMIKLLGGLPPSWWDRWETGREWYLKQIKTGGELEANTSGNLYDQIMEIGKFDGDNLARSTRKVQSGKEVSSSEKKQTSSLKSSLVSTSHLIAMVEDITTEEAEDLLGAMHKTQSGSSYEIKSTTSGSSNKKDSGSSNVKSMESSEGLSLGKGSIIPIDRIKNLIGGDGAGVGASAKDATATSLVLDFLEPAGTIISEIEAKVFENLLRKGLCFLPDERLPPSEMAKHHWFFDDFATEGLKKEDQDEVMGDEKSEVPGKMQIGVEEISKALTGIQSAAGSTALEKVKEQTRFAEGKDRQVEGAGHPSTIEEEPLSNIPKNDK